MKGILKQNPRKRILIEESHRKARIEAEGNISLGEKVFILSEAGFKPLHKVDFKEQDFSEATRIQEKLKENGGVINMEDLNKAAAKTISLEDEKKPDRTISVDDFKNNLHNLPKEEQNKILSSLEDRKARNEKARREEGFNRLPEDIKAAVGMPAGNLKMLKKDQRTALLKKLDDVLEIERKKHQDNLIAEAVK